MAATVRIPAALLAALVPAGALADGISGYVEESVAVARTDDTDSAGVRDRIDSFQFAQRYRLSVDRNVLPPLRVTAGGLFERTIVDTEQEGASLSSASRAWNAFGNLVYTLPTLTLAAGYNRREAFAAGSSGLVSEEYSAFATWRPETLPLIFVRLARPATWDTTHLSQDLTSWEGLLSATWSPARPVDLGYSVSYSNPSDHVRGSETTTWLQTGRVAYGDRLFDGRSTAAVSATATRRITEVHASGAGATIATPQTPIAGLSLVETGISTRERDTLVANGALINGDLTASAGVNLGFSATLAGDLDYRDVGAQLADAATPVNTFYVWVDRDLTPEVAQALVFEVWKSDDNLAWSQLPVVEQFFAQFVSLQDRFEITIPETQSRYLKVVTRPLLAAVTTDRRFADIFVTELQLLLVRALGQIRRTDVTNGGILSASLRTLFVPSLSLAHDVSVYLSSQQRVGETATTVWAILNGLSASRQLSEIVLVSARVARQDSDQLRGHEGAYLYSASLAATPLPALTHTLVYSGQLNQTVDGDTTTNAVSLFNQLTPYEGIGLVAGLSYNVTTNPVGQTSRTDSLTITSTIQPNPKLTLAGSFAHSATITDGGGLPRTSSATNRLDATVTFVPVRAIYASVTATRVVQQPRPLTLGSATLGFNPFPGGDLQAGASYNETLDADDSRTRFFGPFVRWNIRRGAVLNVSYTILDTDRHAQGSQHSRTFGANLAIPL